MGVVQPGPSLFCVPETSASTYGWHELLLGTAYKGRVCGCLTNGHDLSLLCLREAEDSLSGLNDISVAAFLVWRSGIATGHQQ